jgi:lipopolysaccharide export system ATP-binding protein
LSIRADAAGRAADAALRARGLRKRYRSRHVVKDVSFEVRPGEIVGLLGPNGAGKTTTFYMIVGLVRPNGGEVTLNGRGMTHLPLHRRALAGINYLAQEPSIFRKLSVEENLSLILEQHRVARDARRARVDGLLEEFHLTHLRRQPAFTLSGGERRRVEIARALAMRPRYVLLDEPFTGVDPLSIQDIQDMIRYLRDQGIGVLISDHNVRETLSITDRAAIMFEGRILLEGTSEELTQSDEARKLYLGDRFKL